MSPKWQDKVSPAQPKVSGSVFAPGDEPPAIIILVTGEDAESQPQWAYVKILAQNYVPFKTAEEKGNYNLSDYGTILKSGRGKTPPDSIRKEMHEQYGCEEDFEESLAKMMEEAIALWNDGMPKEDNS